MSRPSCQSSCLHSMSKCQLRARQPHTHAASHKQNSRHALSPNRPRLHTITAALSGNQHEELVSRRTVLHGFSWPGVAVAFPGAWAGLLEEQAPQTGSCPTCIGVVDDTLGSCAGVSTCMSSYDDRPGHFIAPWSYELRSAERALDKIEEAVLQEGGQVQAREPGYLYATFDSGLGGTDDVEFLLPKEDTTVELRAASRLKSLPDWGRIENRFEELRKQCGFEVVPVLRNRTQLFGVVESPWDKFGPTPPTDMDYRNFDDFVSP